ncbi:hypothetical protein CCACVL1_07502 [Corchorus capsularis]|uniref:Uncharacterized protein n=1 Tax=Corchorus capsularis TaxID=210143 RepID=A0A1R3J5Q7_COCAP|nr:hypothetical protein CCACVL1_07502 [Corchorus capsularis]
MGGDKVGVGKVSWHGELAWPYSISVIKETVTGREKAHKLTMPAQQPLHTCTTKIT